MAEELEPGSHVGDYRIDRVIGRGGFGTVYAATHKVIGKAAAVKVLKSSVSDDEKVVERFLDEARAVNQIRHRNIIDIFDFGQLADGRHYYVMEYLGGTSLEDEMRVRGGLSLREILDRLRGVSRALHAAHETGVIHRDLKPANIMVDVGEDGAVFVKLLDFGIAKLTTRTTTATLNGIISGTPAYMSPEQCRSLSVDARADIYALGVLAFELITGRLPFNGESAIDVMLQHASDDPPAPSSVASVPVELDAPILAMLAKDPGDRPPTARAAYEALALAAAPHLDDLHVPFDRSGPLAVQPTVSAEAIPQSAPAEANGTTVVVNRPWLPLGVGAVAVGFGVVVLAIAMREPEPHPDAARVSGLQPSVSVAAPEPDSAPVCSSDPTRWCTLEGLIDDMEDGDGQLCSRADRSGHWVSYSDGTGRFEPPVGDVSSMPAIPGCRGQSGRALHLSGRGIADWGAAVAAKFERQQDLTRHTGIRFWARAESATPIVVMVACKNTLDVSFGGECRPIDGKECHDHFGVVRTIGPGWSRYNVPFADLHQEGHGVPASFDVASVMELHFAVHRTPERPGVPDFDVWIDDVALY